MLRGTALSAARAVAVLRRVAPALAALAFAATLSTASVSATDAVSRKVVIVVGPSAGATDSYIARGREYATLARSLGATVVEIYSPRATWSRVSSAATGAAVLVYLGHGNGFPSPYSSLLNGATQDGLGLNPVDGTGYTAPVKYYGESVVGSSIRLAANSVVLLNHLCYASGSSEPGKGEPTWDVARQRVDNFAAGFIRAGARAVIADAHHPLGYELRLALSSGANFVAAWRKSPLAQGHERSFASKRSAGFTNYLDPDGTSTGFYRALTTTAGFATGSSPATVVAAAPLGAKASTAARVRSAPTTAGRVLTTLPVGQAVRVTAAFVGDSGGRTWAPVQTPNGQRGYVAAWLLRIAGTAVPTTDVVLRSGPSAAARAVATLSAGIRVTVSGSVADSSYRVWLAVRTSSGVAGYVPAWRMRP